MLAVAVTGALSILDAADLKRAPSSVSSCLSLTQATTSSTWAFDNSTLFLASANKIIRYDPTSNTLKDILTSTEHISHIISKDKGTVIYSADDRVHVLECSSSTKISQTIESHKSSITSLSLSNDHTLLATISSNTVHVHNLTLGSHVVLRGLLSFAQNSITTSTFHPHTRTRLLLGIGKQLAVYDVTRPSGPIKSIALNESSSGDIVAITCSPFSKTLVAVATSGGQVGLIDLEKEKGLFRTLNLKVPLTTLAFSPEGAALYMGTVHGKLLIMDLRALDKAPKAVTISETGCRIETMSIQRKLKPGEGASNAKPANTSESTTSRKVSSQATSKSVPSPTRARGTRAASGASPSRRLPSGTSRESVASSRATPKKMPADKKIFSPVRDPLGNSAGDISIQIETLKGVSTPAKSGRRPSASPLHAKSASSPKAPISSRTAIRESESQEALPRRSRTVPAAARAKKSSSSSTLESSAVPSKAHLKVPTSEAPQPGERVSSRPRAGSSASGSGSLPQSASAVSISARSTRPGSSTSRPRSRLRNSSPQSIARAVLLPASRTPSPDLPDINQDPITPIPMAKKSVGMRVLGLGSPEVDRWIRAGKGEDRVDVDRKGKGKMVGFKVDGDEGDGDSDEDEVEERERERERSLSMQVSPMRPSASWQPSPVYQSPANISAGGGSSAHDLLRTIVKDVMYDFQRETRAEMTGLHLDLVRMGRGWKRELRELMQEYAGGIEALREENRKLREENERLRRGY